MEWLPVEILGEICRQAEFRVLKPLRLVSRQMAVLAAKELFNTVYFILLPDSIEKLRQIANHPVIYRHVRSLRYIDDLLNPVFDDYDEWEEYARHVSTDSVSPWHIAKYHRFVYLQNLQSELIRSGFESELFEKILSHFPQLESFHILDKAYFDVHYDKMPIIEKLESETLLPRNYLLTPRDSDQSETLTHDPFIRAFSTSPNKVRHLVFGGVDSQIWGDFEVPAVYTSIRPFVVSTFHQLLSLDLCLGMDGMENSSDDDSMSRFTDFLSMAPNLECLALRLYAAEQHDITDVFTRLTWVNLKRLVLWNCTGEVESFAGFVGRHAPKLRILELKTVKLVESDSPSAPLSSQSLADSKKSQEVGSLWEQASLRIAPALNLDMVTLKNLLDAKQTARRLQGNIDPFSYDFLTTAWNLELCLYLKTCKRGAYFPIYGQPRVLFQTIPEDGKPAFVSARR